jgi:hypothetical protein
MAELAHQKLDHLLAQVRDLDLRESLRAAINRERPVVECVLDMKREDNFLTDHLFQPGGFLNLPRGWTLEMTMHDGAVYHLGNDGSVGVTHAGL